MNSFSNPSNFESNSHFDKNQYGVDFIIFHKNAFQDVNSTIRKCLLACANVGLNDYQIVVVDDGSSPIFRPSEESLLAENRKITYLVNKGTPGIAGAIAFGLEYTSYDIVFPIPGHDMYSIEAMQNVLQLREAADLVLGARTNRKEARPIVKRIASTLVREIYQLFVYYHVADFHGLLLCKKRVFVKYMKSDYSYGHQIIIVTAAIKAGFTLIQTTAPLNLNHNNRPSKKFKESFPSIAGVRGILAAMLVAREIVKSGTLSLQK